MKHKRILGLLLALICILPLTANAESGLSAKICDGQMEIEWNVDCASDCSHTLTVYRDRWPVLVACVAGAIGSYTVPEWYTSAQGAYSVRLATETGCLTANAQYICAEADDALDADEAMDIPAAEPNAKPTPAPTAKPTAKPTVKPTVKPTAQPTAKPTVAPTPMPTLKPTLAPSGGNSSSDLAAQMIALVNQDRASYGVGSVVQDASLTQAACVRAKEIVQKFSHTRPDGSSWSTVYSGAYAENIAKGYATADKCEAAFISSQGHRENLLRSSYTKIGVCAYTVGNVTYWVQLFGK